MAQYAAEITKSFRVSAQCFRPRPEVASAVVLLRTKERTRLSPQEEVAFRALVKAAFAHRRKTLVNSLRDEGYELHSVTETLQRLDIAPTRRAETLSVEDFSGSLVRSVDRCEMIGARSPMIHEGSSRACRRAKCTQAESLGGTDCLPLPASEGSPRPRVARALRIIRPTTSLV